MKGIKIRGTGRCVPQKVLSNEELSRCVETSDEWILSRTGIRQRHVCTTESHRDLCVQAARAAILDAGIDASGIGTCIVATIGGDTLVPAAACMLQKELGLPNDIPCFDLNAACTGFLSALHTTECLLGASEKKYGLVVGCEVLSRVVDWEDRNTCVLFGDGAGAVVVECREEFPSIGAVLGCRGDDTLLSLPGAGTKSPQHISMEGAGVFRFAVEMVPRCMERVLSKHRCTVEDVDFFVFHQANARIIDLVVHKYRIPQEKYYKNIGEYGNTSSASIPLVLSELKEKGMVTGGSRALLVGFGGGMTWGGALVEFL